MSEVLAPVSATAEATVLNTGMPSTSWPALPGVTPATTAVPYSRLRRAWKRPSRPVRPWTTSRVRSSMRMAMLRHLPWSRPVRPPCGRRRAWWLPGRPARTASRPEAPGPPRRCAVQAHDQGDLDLVAQAVQGVQDPLGDQVAAGDAAEDVDQHAADLGVGQDH